MQLNLQMNKDFPDNARELLYKEVPNILQQGDNPDAWIFVSVRANCLDYENEPSTHQLFIRKFTDAYLNMPKEQKLKAVNSLISRINQQLDDLYNIKDQFENE